MNNLARRFSGHPFELSAIKAMELAASKLPDAISLAQGIPSFSAPKVIKDFAQERIAEGACDKYSLTNGLSELRDELASSLQDEGFQYDPESEIIVTAGSIEGITAAMVASTKPGDEVLIPSPSYASYLGSIRIARCLPRYFELNEEENFDFQVARIEEKISRKTSVILFCSPNNPTGTLFSERKVRDLVRLAQAHNLTIIVDEVYKDFYYTEDKHFSPASIPEARDRVIRVHSFSKSYAMTGWRVGFLCADNSRTREILKYHDAMVTCAPVPSQYAALAAVRYGQEFFEEFRVEYKARRDLAISMLDQMSIWLDYQVPKATYFVFPRIKDSVTLSNDSQQLAYDILEKARVAFVPGIAFGPSGESHLRINFGRDREDITRGLERLADYFAGRSSHSPKALHEQPRTATRKPFQPQTLFKRFLRFVLAQCARHYLRRNPATIIGIAGIRGKTVFKRQIAELLRHTEKVRAGILSYNSDVGLPLSVLDLKSPRTRKEKAVFPFRLLHRTLFSSDNAEILVLEYGILSQQDGVYLRTIAEPDWLVVTSLSGNDPSVDYHALQNGIDALAQHVPAERILWPQDEATSVVPGKTLKAELALDPTMFRNTLLVTRKTSYQTSREFVGRSSLLSALAAVLLAESLGMGKLPIEAFLNAQQSRGD